MTRSVEHLSIHRAETGDKPRVLFVDDERRVLTSMRAMFRRNYEVFLANSGAEALELLSSEPIDVIVSDQRMPGMTGVEMLTEVKRVAPRAMRILLTGYADREAIEASINEGEVFRYLMKPCPPEELQETVATAAAATRGQSAPQARTGPAQVVRLPSRREARRVATPAAPRPAASESAAAAPKPVAVAKPPAPVVDTATDTDKVEILALTHDDQMLADIGEAIDGRRRLHRAADVAEALIVLAENPIGVLVSDSEIEEHEVHALTAALRKEVPELVVIVASDRSDAAALIDLINHGQVFRFLLKPVQPGQCRIWLESAVQRYVELAQDPTAVQRFEAKPRPDGGGMEQLMQGLVGRLRGLRARFVGRRGESDS